MASLGSPLRRPVEGAGGRDCCFGTEVFLPHMRERFPHHCLSISGSPTLLQLPGSP